ncbi:MBL fold metallo-hydrolase [Deinococcus yavapaiensis]|uniref:Metal-dependent hydrolase (Beta-lactamase superfamily II) n=1 Tax=Deinococcus yavapaiensis KR-236 TaxID=694435 RepID=A0A318STJ1_9DEIO|nr:MBL fold metallo-hydrolase [Deinococcus yavapaiensis]PYE56556.1 metal-dependent hydrolase (beta-lactamase superfamily II) [Deinococcus yavapaiensis KR-236]
MNVTWLAAGYCLNIEALTRRGAPWRVARYPAGFALLRHPERGAVLFDTGYHPRFHEATARWPYKAYALLTPVRVREHESAAAQIARLGVAPTDVREVIVSHFHADHLGGLKDFPRATFRFHPDAYETVRGKSGMEAVRRGFLPDLLPDDFEARSEALTGETDLPSAFAPFTRGFDVFGDESAWAVNVPGHAAGQIALIVRGDRGSVLLAADSAWSTRALRDKAGPHKLAERLFADPAEEKRSFARVSDFMARHPDALVLPSHCPEAPTVRP